MKRAERKHFPEGLNSRALKVAARMFNPSASDDVHRKTVQLWKSMARAEREAELAKDRKRTGEQS